GETRQSFQIAHPPLVAFDYCAWAITLNQQLDPHLFQRVHTLRQRLNDKAIVVAIDDERGQQVAFAVHQSVGSRAFDNLAAQSLGGNKTRAPESAIQVSVFKRDESKGDLRAAAI